MNWLLVFLGGGLGSAARFGLSLATLRLGWITFPYATLIVNVVGCFLLGLLTELLALKLSLPQTIRLFLTTGFLGGFTTFSTFSLETALYIEQARTMMAIFYLVLSVGLSIGALFVGMALIRTIVV